MMSAAADAAGLAESEIEALLQAIHAEPERAFEDMRALLLDVSHALYACASVTDALAALERFGSHRFAPLLHHYQLSNWVLYARAFAKPDPEQEALAKDLDATLRSAPSSLDWLGANWVPGGIAGA
jgi:hypothetical protein